MTDLKLIAKQAREASNKLAFISTKDKNAALEWIAKYLLAAKA
jgi:gamma-glutamyl phosphate reductase